MSQNELVRVALNNRWLEEQGGSGHECPGRNGGFKKPRSLTAWTERSGVKAIRRVVWDPGANYSRGSDSACLSLTRPNHRASITDIPSEQASITNQMQRSILSDHPWRTC